MEQQQALLQSVHLLAWVLGSTPFNSTEFEETNKDAHDLHYQERELPIASGNYDQKRYKDATLKSPIIRTPVSIVTRDPKRRRD